MAVLTRGEIIILLKKGRLKISPFSYKQIGAGSIDLHLGSTFRVFKKTHGIFYVNDNADYKKITQLVKVRNGDSFIILPGELAHGITEEKITLPVGISARIDGRSRFARIGLLTHLSSSFVQPGTAGKIVLEIANLSPIPLAIKPGTKICQLILEETKGNAKYKGKFYSQTKP
jgi:dCTP deaminase